MKSEHLSQPLLVELDDSSRNKQLDAAEQWFDNVLMTQAAFRQLTRDTLEEVREPHVRNYLQTILEHAETHQQQAEQLYTAIGRKPSTSRKLGGAAMAKFKEGLAALVGTAGGATNSWYMLHRLYLASLNSMSAFGAAQQLGLALGIPEIVETATAVTQDKFAHHRQLQEIVLDMVPAAILYKMEI